jgi:ferredoxin
MALYINEDCIACDACVSECPNTAIYAPDEEWSYADGTSVSGEVTLADGTTVDADAMNEALSDEFTFIVAGKCTECKGFNDEPACVDVCPTDAIHVNEDLGEDEEFLLKKKAILHD